jgi:hypothetical protein
MIAVLAVIFLFPLFLDFLWLWLFGCFVCGWVTYYLCMHSLTFCPTPALPSFDWIVFNFWF